MIRLINNIADSIEKFDSFVSRVSGYFYSYRVKFSYKDKRGFELFNWTQFIGISSKAYIIDFRGLKVNNCRILKDERFNGLRNKLCNGTIDMEILCYVGRINLKSNKKL